MTALALITAALSLGLGEARQVAYWGVQQRFADIIDGRTHVQPCRRVTVAQARCGVTVTGRIRCRMVVTVTRLPTTYMLRARHLTCA